MTEDVPEEYRVPLDKAIRGALEDAKSMGTVHCEWL